NNNLFQNLYAETNNYLIYASDAVNITFIDSVLNRTNAGDYISLFDASGLFNLTNVTLTQEGTNFGVATTGYIQRYWYVFSNVSYANGTMAVANLDAKNNTNALVATGTTDGANLLEFTVQEYYEDVNGLVDMNNHSFNASKAGYVDDMQSWNVSQNLWLNFTLQTGLTDCGELGDANTVYYLQNDVSAPGTCFNVTANNVTLEAQGYTINYSYAGIVGYGLVSYLYNNTIVRDAVVIEGNATNDEKYGIYFYGNYNSLIENTSIQTSGTYSHGILVNYGVGNSVKNSAIQTSGSGIASSGSYGVYILAASSQNLSNNVVTATGDYNWGIRSYNSNGEFRNNTVTTSGDVSWGIGLTHNSQVTMRDNNVTTDKANSYYFLLANECDLDTSNLAEGLPVVYNYSSTNTVLFEDVDLTSTYGQLICHDCENVTYDNVTIGNDGITLTDTWNSSVINCNISTDNGRGIMVFRSLAQYNNISGNSINTTADSCHGIAFDSGWYATINSNNVQTWGDGAYGLVLGEPRYLDVIGNNVTTYGSASSVLYLYRVRHSIFNGNRFYATAGDSTALYLDGINNSFYGDRYNSSYYAIHLGAAENNTFENIYAESDYTYLMRDGVDNNTLFIDSVINATGTYFFYRISSGNGLINLTNVTMPNDLMSGTSYQQIFRYWYVFSNVTYALNDSMVNGATVEAWNNTNGQVATGITDGVNLLEFTVLEYFEDRDGRIDMNNHTFNASKSGYVTDTQSWNISINRWLNFTLSANVSALHVDPLNYWYLNDTIKFECSASTYNDLDNATLYHNYSSNWLPNVSVDISGTYAEFEFNLSGLDQNGTVFVWGCQACDVNGECAFSDNRTITIDTSIPRVWFSEPTPTDDTRNTTYYNWAMVNVSTSDDHQNYSAYIDWNRLLTGWWRLENETGTTYSDTSTYGNDGTCSGSSCPELWTGYRGKGQRFDGVDDYINISNANLYDSSETNMTFVMWVRSDDYSSKQVVLSRRHPCNNDGVFNIYTQLNDVYFAFRSDIDGASVAHYSSSDVLTDGEWHQIVWVKKWGELGTKLYVDGADIAFTGDSANNGTTYTGHPVLIGAQWSESLCIGPPTKFFNGTIDDVMIFNRLLSSEEVNASYQNGLYDLYSNFTGLSSGTVNYTAYVYDMAGNLNRTEYRDYSVNYVPNVTIIEINSSEGSNYSDENISVWYTTDDGDGDVVKNITNWYLDGESIAVLNMPFESNTQLNMSSWTKDYSGWENHGTVDAIWDGTAGYDSQGAYEFGVGDYIEMPSIHVDTIAVAAWFNTTDKSFEQRIVSKTHNGEYQLSLINSGLCPTSLCFIVHVNGTYYTAQVSTASVTNNKWHHVVGTYDGETVSLYLDGNLVGVNTTPSGPITPLSVPICIGAEAQAGSCSAQEFRGVLDEVQIYNGSLTVEQIQALFENQTDLIVSQETSVGDDWQACVTPNDGFEDGVEQCSVNLTVLSAEVVPLQVDPLDAWQVNDTIKFECNATSSNDLVNGSLWHNFTGWSEAASTTISGTFAEYEFNLSGFNQEKTIVWACAACDVTGQCNISNNQTLTIDLTAPNIEFVLPTPANNVRNTTFYNWAYVNVSTSDANGNYSSFVDWNRSLVGWWRLENETGGEFLDSSTYENNGTCTNCPESWTGYRGKGQRFDGSNDYIETADDPLDFGTGDFSIESWFYIPKHNNDWRSIVNKGGSGAAGYGLTISGSNRLTADIQASGGTNQHVSNAATTVTEGEWHHGVAVFDRDDQVYVYLDGELGASEGYSAGNDGSVNSSFAMKIGKFFAGSSWFFNGTIDEVRLWDRALSAQEVNASYQNGVYDLYRNFTGLPSGRVNYTAYAGDMAGNLNRTEYRNYSVNYLPNVTIVEINSTDGGNLTHENVTVYFNSSDQDGDDVKNITNWYLNGTSVVLLNMPFESNTQLNISSWTKDYSGLENHGIVNGAVWNSTGGYDGKGAYDFANSNIQVDWNIDMKINRTIAFWVKTASIAGNDVGALSVGNVERESTPQILFQRDAETLKYNGGDGWGQGFKDIGNLTLNKWHHVVATYNGIVHKLYFDGSNVDTITANAGTSSDDAYLFIGEGYDGEWSGAIDEVLIYNRALSPEQVALIYVNMTDTIVSQELTAGDEWAACITPNDGLEDGVEQCSVNLTLEQGCVDADGDGWNASGLGPDSVCGVYRDCDDTNASVRPPTDNSLITEDTWLCSGTYYVNDTGGVGVERFVNDSVTLTCMGTVVVGNNSGTGVMASYLNVTVQGCTWANYSKGIAFGNLWNYTFAGSNDYAWYWDADVSSNDDIALAGLSYDPGDEEFLITKLDIYGNKLWDWTYDVGSGYDLINGVVFDSEGNVIGAGHSNDSGQPDGFIIKLDSEGNHDWNLTYAPSSGYIRFDDVAVDSSDNVIVGAGNNSHQVYKVLSNGTRDWNYTSGTVGHCRGVAVDSQDNIYCVGENDTSDGFAVIKLDEDGNEIWGWTHNPSSSGDTLLDAVVDHDDNLVVAGYRGGGNFIFYVAKLNSSDGASPRLLWNWTYNATSLTYAEGVTVDSQNNIYAVGRNYDPGQPQMFAVKLDTDGNHLRNWTYNPGSGYDALWGVAVDSLDNPVVAGGLTVGSVYPAFAARLTSEFGAVFNNSVLFNNTLVNNTYGVYGAGSAENGTVYNITLYDNDYGLFFDGKVGSYGSSEFYWNEINDSSIAGMNFSSSYDNLVHNNTLYNNSYGVYVASGTGNAFYYNNFSNSTTLQAYAVIGNHFNITASPCTQYCARGNWWSDILYNGLQIGDYDSNTWGDFGPSYPYSLALGANVSSNVVDYGPQPITLDCYDNDGDGWYNTSSDASCAVYFDCDDTNSSIRPPQDNSLIVNDTWLCSGTYYVNDTDATGVERFGVPNVTLTCLNTTIIGNGEGMGVVMSNNYVEMKDCTWSNYQRAVAAGNLWEYWGLVTGETLLGGDIYDNDDIVFSGYGWSGTSSTFHLGRLHSNGTLDWNWTRNESSGDDLLTGIVIDSNDDLVVSGYDSVGTDNQFHIIKFDGEGTWLWNWTNDQSAGDDRLNGVDIDSSDNIVVAGFDELGGDRRFHIIKFNSAGTRLWNWTYDQSAGVDGFSAVKVDSDDSIIAVGGDNYLGGVDGRYHVVKLDSDGNLLWNWTHNPFSNNDNLFAVEIDSEDNIIVAGTEWGVGWDSQWHIIKLNGSDASMSEGERVLWNYTHNATANNDGVYAVKADSDDNIYVGGWTAETLFVGDQHVIKLNSSGDLLANWTQATSNSEVINVLLVDSTDNPIACGTPAISGWSTTYFKRLTRDLTGTVTNITIFNSSLVSSTFSMYADFTINSTYYNNTFFNSVYGAYIASGSDNYIYNNTVYNNSYGVYVASGTGNTFYYNNFSNNTIYQAYAGSTGNEFNTTVVGVAQGNWWSDILYNALFIYDSDGDGWGDIGSEYPYSAALGGNVSGNVTDWGPQPANVDNSPVVATVVLNATDHPLNLSTANLTAHASGITDVEGHDVSLVYNWYVSAGQMLTDGDMEAEETGNYSAGGGGTLSKETGNPSGSGTQVLRVTKDAAAADWAVQDVIDAGTTYRVTGWYRGDGTANPVVGSNTLYWKSGTSSTTWQSFDIKVTTSGAAGPYLYAAAGGASNWVEFDDVVVQKVNSTTVLNMPLRDNAG
ncbi:LamG-like jellyroll fold domain-containing protein, partial [Nanoarchaeota archaeon]